MGHAPTFPGRCRLHRGFPGWSRAGGVGGHGRARDRFGRRQSKTQAAPGDQIVIAVILDHEEHWHSQADAAQQKLVKNNVAVKDTTIEPAAAKGLKFGPVQWPPAVLVSAAALGDPTAQVAVFEGRAIAYIPVVIEAGASGTVSVPIEVMYQACDDAICQFPVTEKLTVEVAIVGTVAGRWGAGGCWHVCGVRQLDLSEDAGGDGDGGEAVRVQPLRQELYD